MAFVFPRVLPASDRRMTQHLGVEQSGVEVPIKTTVRGLNPQLARHALYDEPRGSVGRRWRTFFLCYYGPFLMKKPVKVRTLQVYLHLAAGKKYFTRNIFSSRTRG